MSLAHHILEVQVELRGFFGIKESMENPQTFYGGQLCAFGAQRGKVTREIRSNPCKVSAGLLNIFLQHRSGNELLLYHAVATGSFIQKNLIAFPAILVELISSQRHENGLFELSPVDHMVKYRDFGAGSTVQAIQQLAVVQKHCFLICFGCYQIVDILKAKGLGELAPNPEDTILPHGLNGDHILYLSRHAVPFFFLMHQSSDCLDHESFSPLFSFSAILSFSNS